MLRNVVKLWKHIPRQCYPVQKAFEVGIISYPLSKVVICLFDLGVGLHEVLLNLLSFVVNFPWLNCA
jgi:hypothetical protein